MAHLVAATQRARELYLEAARELSAARAAAAAKLDRAVARELPPLKLEKATFRTRREPLPEAAWSAHGIERINFEVATNPGLDPGPLDKIASGGELARFMLALKVVLARSGATPTMVFDEVDSGIGGAAAAAVGERLARLASDVQVLVVTHSPQVAARADHHWRVSKKTAKGAVVTVVEPLDEAARREEIARLLSGASQGEVRAASSGLAQAEQRVERSRLALERTRIAAPFSGRVADLEVEVGQQIGPGETLFTLLQDDRLKVDVDVLEADIVRQRPGAPARVTIPSADGLVLEGSVYAINPRVDSTTGTGKVTVAIDNPRGLLLSGLFANVELETRRLPGRLIVPAEALLARQGRDLVFRIEKGRALWTYVTVGERSGEQVEITEGLSQGDLIAAGQHFALAHEAPVEAVLTEGTGAARR